MMTNDTLIVPFVFNLYEYSKDKPMLLWVFYKYVNFCLKYNMPIIAQEDFFKDPNVYIKNNHYATKPNFMDYTVPKKEDFDILSKYIISNDILNIKNYSSRQMHFILLKKRNKKFEKVITDAIDEIEKKENKKISAIITWISFPSLEFVCKNRNIKLINYELSSIRKGIFNETLGYFSFNNKYNSKQFKNNYLSLKNENINILSRREILSLFLKTDFLHYVNKINDSSEKELGLAFGLKNDPFELAYNDYSNIEIIKKVKTIFDDNEVIIRTHPAYPYLIDNKIMHDNTGNSLDWVLKCKRIITTVSNVGYEAMMLGKTSYVLSKDMPFSIDTINELNNIEEYVVDLKYLNYITFGFYAPFDLMFDIDYIRWRLTMPTALEIYNYNLDYILRKNNIEDIFEKMPKDRQKYILKKVQKLNNRELEEFVNYNCYSKEKAYINKINELDNILKAQKNYIEKIDNELNTIINSNGWKLLEKLRTIKRIGRKK